MRQSIAVVLISICGLAPAAEPVKPAETLYSVEVVVFRYLSPLGVPEDWGVGTDTPPVSGAGSLAVRPLSPADFRLGGTEAALGRNQNYRVLAHVGWIQSAAPRGAGLAVDLGSLGVKDPALRGTATLEQGRYLYLGLDLAYSPADPPTSLVGAQDVSRPTTFALKQKRRVKTAERHYFDHPAFGAIATVAALKPSAAAD